MIKSQIARAGTMSNGADNIADATQVTKVLEADEIGQIKLVNNEESELDESMDEAAAEEEEVDELEEESEVEAAAEANRK